MSESLKPCPFCDGEAEIKPRYIGYGSVGLGAHDWYTVKCKNCRANSGEYGVKDKAIAAWDCRPPEPEAKPLTLEELQERDGKEVYCCWKTKREIVDWDIENPHKAKVNVFDESVSNKTVKHYFDQYGTRFIAYDRQPGEGARG